MYERMQCLWRNTNSPKHFSLLSPGKCEISFIPERGRKWDGKIVSQNWRDKEEKRKLQVATNYLFNLFISIGYTCLNLTCSKTDLGSFQQQNHFLSWHSILHPLISSPSNTLRLGCYFKRKKTAYISTGWSGFWIQVFQNKISLLSRVLDFSEEIFNPRN